MRLVAALCFIAPAIIPAAGAIMSVAPYGAGGPESDSGAGGPGFGQGLGGGAASIPQLGVVDPLEPYDSARLYKDVAILAERYPTVLTVSSIGESALGNDIPLLKLGRGPRNVLWVGALHSREVITTAYLMLVAEEYAYSYVSNSPYAGRPPETLRRLLDEFTVYIVPMANPDGVDIATAAGPANVKVASASAWKSNANGVNLNRNFPFDWAANANYVAQGNYRFYKGPAEGSEPETKALMELCGSTAFEHMVSCHTQGQVLYWRDEKNGAVPGDVELANAIADICGFRLLPSTKAAAEGWAGGFENWFRSEYARPGICLEFCRQNVTDKQRMQAFHAPDMIDWQKSRVLLLEVLDSLDPSPALDSLSPSPSPSPSPVSDSLVFYP